MLEDKIGHSIAKVLFADGRGYKKEIQVTKERRVDALIDLFKERGVKLDVGQVKHFNSIGFISSFCGEHQVMVNNGINNKSDWFVLTDKEAEYIAAEQFIRPVLNESFLGKCEQLGVSLEAIDILVRDLLNKFDATMAEKGRGYCMGSFLSMEHKIRIGEDMLYAYQIGA